MLSGLHFASPWFLLGLLVIPLIVLMAGERGPQLALTFSSLALLQRIGARTRGGALGYAFTFFLASLAFAIIAMSRPQVVQTEQIASSNGIEMMLIIDVSPSMELPDFYIGNKQVTRLQAAKTVTQDFIKQRSSDRIGVVAFAGQPYLVSPLTLDHRYLRNQIKQISIGLVEDGTAIGSAIALTAMRLDQSNARAKIIVLITDGANNSGHISPIDAAKLAKTLGIRIYTVAIGTKKEQTIPDSAEKTVEFDAETLDELARIGGGAFFRAEGLDRFRTTFQEINSVEESDSEGTEMTRIKELFPYFLAAAFFIGLAGVVLHEIYQRTSP